MHILFIADNFPPEGNAPATRTYEHARAFNKNHTAYHINCAKNVFTYLNRTKNLGLIIKKDPNYDSSKRKLHFICTRIQTGLVTNIRDVLLLAMLVSF